MPERILTLSGGDWGRGPDSATAAELIAALEDGKVLYFPDLPFELSNNERRFLDPAVRNPKSRNISLRADGKLAGAMGSEADQAELAALLKRFRTQACALIDALAPQYKPHLRLAPTSYRPSQVESRAQSWRADDRRLHVDAFPSRPSYGERILRVFTNANPHGQPRVWRVGEGFEAIARHFVPRAKPYRPWQAKALQWLKVTKSYRSEYDHLMLQLHDGMKGDADYQANCPQQTMPFPAGSTWVCYSDQTSHAVMAGQYMLEQTLHLPAARQVNPQASPLAILQRVTGRPLV